MDDSLIYGLNLPCGSFQGYTSCCYEVVDIQEHTAEITENQTVSICKDSSVWGPCPYNNRNYAMGEGISKTANKDTFADQARAQNIGEANVNKERCDTYTYEV